MGLIHKFAQEYQNEARDVDNAKFHIDRVNYYQGNLENEMDSII